MQQNTIVHVTYFVLHLRTFWTINVVNLTLFSRQNTNSSSRFIFPHFFCHDLRSLWYKETTYDSLQIHRVLTKYNIDGPDGICVGIGFDTLVNNTDIEFRFFRDFLGAEVHKHAFEKGLCIFVFTGTNAALFIRRWKNPLGMINWLKILYLVIQIQIYYSFFYEKKHYMMYCIKYSDSVVDSLFRVWLLFNIKETSR